MNSKKLLSAIIVLTYIATLPLTPCSADDNAGKFLAKFAVDPEPWLHPAADSEQRQPLYLGSTPRELVFRLNPADNREAVLYESLRAAGEEQMKLIRDSLVKAGETTPVAPIEFEAWPVRDERGRLTWAFGRWHQGPGKPWQRLNASVLAGNTGESGKPRPVLPVTLDPAKREEYSLVFDDVLTLGDLYAKPLFSNCLWTTDDGRILEAWLSPDRREAYAAEIGKDAKEMGSTLLCRVLPQPPRLNGRPVTFFIGLDGDSAVWPATIRWKREETALPELIAPRAAPAVAKWPDDFAAKFRQDVLALSGEEEAAFPGSKRKAVFKKKNSAESDNNLQDVVVYLEERYKQLGIRTWRQDFVWRGIRQTNIIAVIPGADRSADPVIMAAHMDAAFSEDVFKKANSRARVSSPGAGDGASATAALLRAAGILPALELEHDVWLVHLTGEEFPGDRLGSRRFVGWLLKEGVEIGGAIVIDRIGHRMKADPIFQINAGDAPGSLLMAKVAFEASRKAAAGLEPVLRTRFHPQGRVADSGALIFSEGGFPAISMGEHVNTLGAVERTGYRDSADTSQTVDWEYAIGIAKAVIEAAAELAGMKSIAPSAAASPEWSVIVYAAADEPDGAKTFAPWFEALNRAAVPSGVEVLVERDAEWPDGTARIARTAVSHEESDLRERDSASPAAFTGFLRWAKERARGKYRILVVRGRAAGLGAVLQDAAVPGQEGRRSVMPAGLFASILDASGLRPDIIFFDMPYKGNVELIETLKGAAPYLVVPQFDVPGPGFPPARLFALLVAPGVGPLELARALPEEYVREYAHDGPAGSSGGEYATVSLAAVDTARWDEFSHKFKMLASALGGAGFAAQVSAQPGWGKAVVGPDGNADLVEFLGRVPLAVNDLAARSIAAEILDDIGYPGRVASDSAATIAIDAAQVRSFELRIEAPARLQRETVLPKLTAAWKEANRDLGLPDGLSYDFTDFKEDGKDRREFIVRCPSYAMKKAVVLRPWLAGARYAVLKTIDRDSRPSEKKYFRDKDYFSARDFPATSIFAGEAHSQGEPFAHGLGIALRPASGPARGGVPYGSTEWSARTGWGDLISAIRWPDDGRPRTD